jgi:hypothetical protein
VGLVFAGLVVVHLAQRRHRIARMLAQLTHFPPAGRARVTSVGVGCNPDLPHGQRCAFGDPRLGPRGSTAPPSSAALRQVALDLLGPARRVHGRPRLAPMETPPTVHHPIAPGGPYAAEHQVTPQGAAP